ncbi:hypothetical protein BpHYR1_045412 [Brachionus plicatilis]|uniref:Uncharacterized protein n=1 Tax=Brachionus plicatilis TaxID=10195 RepID=A0A3M7QYE9_BRAPC|nr:hypothetical protein BpHYR1_045412 [Brachionus plicatilis]
MTFINSYFDPNAKSQPEIVETNKVKKSLSEIMDHFVGINEKAHNFPPANFNKKFAILLTSNLIKTHLHLEQKKYLLLAIITLKDYLIPFRKAEI